MIDKKGCTEFEQNVADGGAYSWPDDRSTPGQEGNSIVAVELSSVLNTGWARLSAFRRSQDEHREDASPIVSRAGRRLESFPVMTGDRSWIRRASETGTYCPVFWVERPEFLLFAGNSPGCHPMSGFVSHPLRATAGSCPVTGIN